jgi:hypothetical protein
MSHTQYNSLPRLPPITATDRPLQPYQQPPPQALTLHEIERAINRANPRKAPGIDGIPMLVWRELWPVLKDHIFVLFNSSLQLGKLPHNWKIAKIIPLRKGIDRDYALCASYRPISLLPTISKIMESVIAERISHLVEELNLLPKNHFGARKARSTVQALTILQERILAHGKTTRF